MIEPEPPASFGTVVVSTVPNSAFPRLILIGITRVSRTGREM